MSTRRPLEAGKAEFSSAMTRDLVGKAEQLFGAQLEPDQVEAILGEVLGDAEHLADHERDQLEQIVQLIAASKGRDIGSGLSCAGSYELEPAEDRMFVLLSIRPPVGEAEAVGVETILQDLKGRGITQGVDLKAIKQATEAAAAGNKVGDVMVVRGRPAKPGRDGRLERYARRSTNGPLDLVSPLQLERAGEEALLCQQGDMVMRYVPPATGEAGYTALGDVLEPVLPRELAPTTGRNIKAEGDAFVTLVTGVVIFEQEHVEARKALIIHQDLTRKSEPIDFDGEVQVRAAVRTGATIRATGNITVTGPVEAAEIESLEGDVVLNNGVAGKDAAVVKAARDVIARFTESASVLAGRDINLQTGSLHSRLTAYRSVNASQGKGHVAGGTITAGEFVRVKQLGARGGMRTEVTVGLSREVLRMLGQIDQLTTRARLRQEQCAELVAQMDRAVGDPAKLNGRELRIYLRLRQLRLACDVQIRKLNERRAEVLVEAARNADGRVEVLANILSDVHIVIGSAEMDAESRSGFCTFVFDDDNNKIVVRRGR